VTETAAPARALVGSARPRSRRYQSSSPIRSIRRSA
jgi:hypothetical protein